MRYCMSPDDELKGIIFLLRVVIHHGLTVKCNLKNY